MEGIKLGIFLKLWQICVSYAGESYCKLCIYEIGDQTALKMQLQKQRWQA